MPAAALREGGVWQWHARVGFSLGSMGGARAALERAMKYIPEIDDALHYLNHTPETSHLPELRVGKMRD